MDNVRNAEGAIYLLDPTGDPQLLGGIGTKFDGPGFEVGGSIHLLTTAGESLKLNIGQICGPQKIILKSTPTVEAAIYQLSQPGGTSFKVSTHVDQTEVYMPYLQGFVEMGALEYS